MEPTISALWTAKLIGAASAAGLAEAELWARAGLDGEQADIEQAPAVSETWRSGITWPGSWRILGFRFVLPS